MDTKVRMFVDPSLRQCGYAIFREEKLALSGILESSDKNWELAVNEIAHALRSKANMNGVTLVGIEMPTQFHSPGGHAALHSGAVGKLFYTVGYLTAFLEENAMSVIHIPVGYWKGQLPKQLTTQRINRRYNLQLNWKSKENNQADAIAIGTWFLDKYKQKPSP